MQEFTAPAFVRGKTIKDHLVEFSGRGYDISFSSPDTRVLLKQLPLGSPGMMSDLYDLSLDNILDFLHELGTRLKLSGNEYLQEALRVSCMTSGLTESLLRTSYERLPDLFNRDFIRQIAEKRIGVPYLEGWVDHEMRDGRIVSIRAFGSRTLHIVAGNSPVVSAITIIRNAITRSDAIIKTPSNDPLSALAIARTMGDVEPDHPLTRHLAVAYWKGGDEGFEQQLYQPHNIEKIVAWGGLQSVRHVTRYIQPGLELISMDPKLSTTIIGPEAFESEETMRGVARRAAMDVGVMNQEGCVNARVIYVVSGTDEKGLERLNRFGEFMYSEMTGLPSSLSTKPKRFNPELKANLEALRLDDEWYRVIGGTAGEGAIIVSLLDEPVNFASLLSCRVANLVPVDEVSDALKAVNAYTQTVGIYPESLKTTLRDQLPLYGAQRLVSLGYASHGDFAGPHDAIEPLRRMCKWIVCESCDPARTPLLWEK